MGQFITYTRFFEISKALTLAKETTTEKQILALIEILNETFQHSMTAGSNLTINESIVASRHKDLAGKKRIMRKLRPVGVEIKSLAHSASRINLVLEKSESKEIMADKEYHKEFGATTACTLRLTQPYHGTGRVEFGDSCFRSVKSCLALKALGLHSTFVVKTAHSNFPKKMFYEMGSLKVGKWNSLIHKHHHLLAVRYKNKKLKLLVSSFSASPDQPRLKKSRRYGLEMSTPQPKIFEEYCAHAGAIDAFHHYRTGGMVLEDSWKIWRILSKQFSGLVGFVESNAFLAMKYFSGSNIEHNIFIKNLAKALLNKEPLSALVLIPRLGKRV